MESKKSFRISFATLFDRDKVVIKDQAKVESMTEVHNKLIEDKPVTDAQLYDYLVCLWSFIEFVRANRGLETTVPLEFVVKGIVGNCYWWEVLMATNYYADRIVGQTVKPETKAKLEAFRNCRAALGLLYKCREVDSIWTKRGTSTAFANEVKKQFEINRTLHKALWVRALTIGAQEMEKDLKTTHTAAQLYATVYELTDKRDKMILAAGLRAESLHRHHIAEFGMAIALAEAYERVTKDAAHPELSEWQKINAATWKAEVPAALDPGVALSKVGKSNLYEKGAVPEKVILFAIKA